MKRLLLLCSLYFVTSSLYSGDTITLDLSAYKNAYPQTADGCWTGVYNDDERVETGLFRFSHNGSPDEGNGMAYWDGFIYCTSGDNTNYGTEGSSDGWVNHQWGCMAGGGLNAQGKAQEGMPYLVAYWGYYEESLDDTYHSLRVDFTDNKQYQPVGVYLCNHPWPYYGNENGDGFASAFTQEGDYFGVVIHGLNAAGEDIGITVKHELAAYRNGELVQSPDWQYVNLSSLGAVSALYFTMETTDEDALYGANTAVFFCLDRLSVATPTTTLERPANLHITAATENTLTMAWNNTEGATHYRVMRDNAFDTLITDTFYTFTDLHPAVSYTLSVQALYGTDSSDIASLTATTPDMTPPVMQGELHTNVGYTEIQLSWQPAVDNVGIRRYTIYLNDEPYKRTTQTTHTLTGLYPDTDYNLAVEAEDEAGNISNRLTVSIRTRGESAIQDIQSNEPIRAVFTLDGLFLGTSLPQKPGVYIVQQQTTYIILIN